MEGPLDAEIAMMVQIVGAHAAGVLFDDDDPPPDMARRRQRPRRDWYETPQAWMLMLAHTNMLDPDSLEASLFFACGSEYHILCSCIS